MIELYLRVVAEYVAYGAEALGILTVAAGLARVLWRYAGRLATGKGEMSHVRIRLELGQSLGLALEFLLAADLVRTAVAPDWDAIGRLGVIVAIRTVLNFFLQREMEHEKKELRGEDVDTGSGHRSRGGRVR